MAEKLGITIDFKGDSTDFDETINGINKRLRSLGTQAKTLNQELKINPNNWEIQQKLIALNNERITELKNQVTLYKQEMEELNKSSLNWTKDQAAQYKSLEKSMLSAEKQILKLEKANNDLSRSQSTYTQWIKKLEEVEKGFQKVSNQMGEMAKQFAVVSAAAASALTMGVKYNAEMEQYTIALTTALGSEEQALSTIEQIKKDAEKTPWGVKELVEYNRTLIATGLSAEESEDIILSLGDAVSAVGGTSDVFSRMVQNLQQIKNAGNATAMDIRQFANAGIDIYGILSDYLGKTTDQISEQDRTWENIIGAFKKANSEGGKYFQAMEKQSESLTAQLSKLKDEVSQTLGEIAEGLMPVIKKIVAKLKEVAKYIKNLDDEQLETIGNVLVAVAAITPLLKGIQIVTNNLGTLTTGIKGVLTSLKGGKGLIAAMGTSFPTAMVLAGVGLVALIGYLATTSDTALQTKQALDELAKESDTTFSNSLQNLQTEQNNVNNCLKDIKFSLENLDYNPNGTIDKTSEKYKTLVSRIDEYHSYIGDNDTSVDEEISKLRRNIESVDDLATAYKNVYVEKERSAWLEAHQEEYDTALQKRQENLAKISEIKTKLDETTAQILTDNPTITPEKLQAYIDMVTGVREKSGDFVNLVQEYQTLGGDLNSLLVQYNDAYTSVTNTQSILDDYLKVTKADADTLHATLLSIDGDVYTGIVEIDQNSLESVKQAIETYTNYLHTLQEDTKQYGTDNSAEIDRVQQLLSELWQQAATLSQEQKLATDESTKSQEKNTKAVQDNKTAGDEAKTTQGELKTNIDNTKSSLDEAKSSADQYTESLYKIPSDVYTTIHETTIKTVETRTTSSGSSNSTYRGAMGYSGGFDGGYNSLVEIKNLIKSLKIPNYSLDYANNGAKNGLKLLKPQFASGGFNAGGFNFTLNVNNNGNSISSDSVKKWADIITDRINENLGKEM